MQFIKCCRGLGFSMKQIAVPPDRWNDKQRASSKMKQLAQERAQDLAR
ncbi:MAG: MerR family DNA-binding protein [Proteobacteria bacterium]|nr:MerR family DNA-binding protein [Pseudomonadota bacterium]